MSCAFRNESIVVVLYLPLVADNLLEAVRHAIVVVGACPLASLELPVIPVSPKSHVARV